MKRREGDKALICSPKSKQREGKKELGSPFCKAGQMDHHL